MYTLLIILISLLAILLMVIILLQSGKGGGLAATFGGASSSTDSFMGGRQAATVLTRLTWIGGGVFLFLSLVLAVLSSRVGSTPQSILQEGMGPTNEVPQSPASVLEMETTGETPEGSAGEAEAPPSEGGGESPGESGQTP